ncbi:MAG: hypothetical protein K6F08_00335 [bacterium]|nr:hypothetical protein [bacterium]
MDYLELKTRLKFKNGKVRIIGRSFFGRPIFCVSFNFGARQTFVISASIHARENITTNIALLLAKRLDANFDKFRGIMPNIIIVPLVNPDGVMIGYFGEKSVPDNFVKTLKEINGNNDYRLFKANARGVDLNNNFDAKFNSDPNLRSAPSSQGFAGINPESESETKSIANLVRLIKPAFTISLHSKGEVIYYNFGLKGDVLKHHKKVANFFAKVLKYKLDNNKTLSCGGLKDYCVSKLKIPSITIEVGSDKLTHPITERNLRNIIVRFNHFFDAIISAKNYISEVGIENFNGNKR